MITEPAESTLPPPPNKFLAFSAGIDYDRKTNTNETQEVTNDILFIIHFIWGSCRLDFQQNHENNRRHSPQYHYRYHRRYDWQLPLQLIGFYAHGFLANLIVSVVGACIFIYIGKKLFGGMK